MEVIALVLGEGSALGLKSSLGRGLLPVIGASGGEGTGLLDKGDSFLDQSCLGKDVGEALGDGKGPRLGVHV